MIENITIPVSSIRDTYYMKKNGRVETVDDRLKCINLKKWYKSRYPCDEMGEQLNAEVSLLDVLDGMIAGRDFYAIIKAQDSIIRERIFEKLSEAMGISYIIIYSLWLASNH